MVVIHTSPFVNKWARQFKLGHFCWHMAICSNSAMSLPLTQLATKILSFVFHLAKITGPCLFFVPAIVVTNHQMTVPICSSSISLWCKSGTVSALTLGIHILHSCRWKDKSRMAQNNLLLCGTATSGDIFKFGCGAPLMSSHWMILASPCFTFSIASLCRHVAASGDLAKICRPQSTAATKCSHFQDTPQCSIL